jgi:hypothetical protein
MCVRRYAYMCACVYTCVHMYIRGCRTISLPDVVVVNAGITLYLRIWPDKTFEEVVAKGMCMRVCVTCEEIVEKCAYVFVMHA